MSTSPRTPLCHSTASTPNSTGVKIIIMGIILLSLVPLVLVTQFLMKNENNFELDQQMIMPEQRLVDDDTTLIRRDNIVKNADFTSEAVVASDKLLRDIDNEDVNASNPIPEALQPITFKKCCFSKFEQNLPSDVLNCFSERACNDTDYPFASSTEKEFSMKQRAVTNIFRREIKRLCNSHTIHHPLNGVKNLISTLVIVH